MAKQIRICVADPWPVDYRKAVVREHLQPFQQHSRRGLLLAPYPINALTVYSMYKMP